MIELWVSALVVLAADQMTKNIVLHAFLPNQSRIAVPHVLWWTFVQNQRGAFGLFGDSEFALILMAIVVLGVFYWAFRDLARRSAVVRIAFGGIVGGAIGNIIDRINHHYVIDFIDLRWWPVFNVADSCITIGVAVLLLSSLRRSARSAAPTPEAR